VISVALMTALAALYLAGILDPASNLRHFPVAVDNGDAGPSGAQIVDRLVAGVDKSRFVSGRSQFDRYRIVIALLRKLTL
jgi:uncharacterized phage infection (PIP) family protein YhgE